jgi:hypothetical protein
LPIAGLRQALFRGSHLGTWPAAVTAAGACRDQASPCALDDQRAFELGECPWRPKEFRAHLAIIADPA